MVIHTVETPQNLNVDNGGQITLAVGFQLNVASKTCYGVRFWAPTTNSGTYTALLWVATADDTVWTGTQLAIEAVSSASVTGGTWNTILFDTPVVMSNANVYKVGVHTSSGRYVSRAGFFTSSGLTGDDITLYQSGADPVGLGSMRNGVFRDGSLGYPNGTFGEANYYLEPIVTAGGGPITADVTRVATTESVRVLATRKGAAVARVSETASARPASSRKARTTGRVTVTDVARPIGRLKTRTLARVAETNSARLVTRGGVSVATGRVTTTETARAPGKAKTTALARTVTTETARSLTRTKARSLGRVATQETARTATALKRQSAGRVLETATARTLTATVASPDVGQIWGVDMGLR